MVATGGRATTVCPADKRSMASAPPGKAGPVIIETENVSPWTAATSI
jgi:hypothetical protein